jgi:hypothetical protein
MRTFFENSLSRRGISRILGRFSRLISLLEIMRINTVRVNNEPLPSISDPYNHRNRSVDRFRSFRGKHSGWIHFGDICSILLSSFLPFSRRHLFRSER